MSTSTFQVKASGAAPKRRFLTTTAAVSDQARMRLAVAGEIPVGVTDSVDLADGEEFTFSVSGRTVWEVEAGEGIDPGNMVRCGTLGKAFVCDPGDLYAVGMALDDAASAGTVIRVAPLRSVGLGGMAGTAPTINNVASPFASLTAAADAHNALLAALRTRGVIAGT
ncbi:capsid cement protein [Streptomyces sp. IBSBF 2950]|uniref:capsid cement protein n=1 Tax=Streptomyces sp. IBSBF 2950 TaxID=2903528 RepID=UPI002FDBED48